MGKSRDYTQMVPESETECGCADATFAAGRGEGGSCTNRRFSQGARFAQLVFNHTNHTAARLLPTIRCRLGGAPMQSMADSRARSASFKSFVKLPEWRPFRLDETRGCHCIHWLRKDSFVVTTRLGFFAWLYKKSFPEARETLEG